MNITTRLKRAVGTLSAAVVLGSGLSIMTPTAPAAAATVPDLGCSGSGKVVKTLESGSSWALCITMEDIRGIVLKNIWFQPAIGDTYHKVLDELALGQINVPYDYAGSIWNDMTQFGFGGPIQQVIQDQECDPSDQRKFPQQWDVTRSGSTKTFKRNAALACVETISEPYGYRSHEQHSMSDDTFASLYEEDKYGLRISAISKLWYYEYITQLTFSDNGEINVNLGATGDVSPSDYALTPDALYNRQSRRAEGARLGYAGPASETGWPMGEGETDYAANHWHNALWKVDFAIDNATTQRVEAMDAVFSDEKCQTVTNQVADGIQTAEGGECRVSAGTSADPDNEYSGAGVEENHGTTASANGMFYELGVVKTELTEITEAAMFGIKGTESDDRDRTYRVVGVDKTNEDGHERSYQFEFGNVVTYDANPITQPLITFTNAKECRKYFSLNLDAGCPDQSIIDYVEQDAGDPLTDPVAWVNVGFHHVVKDEDQSPMPTHWQSFKLVPRDFTYISPVAASMRECINGDPGGAYMHSICENPTATAKPKITQKGKVLTTTDGKWSPFGNQGFAAVNEDNTDPFAYAPLYTYEYKWKLGKKKKVVSTTNTYKRKKADKGKTIVVTVTALPANNAAQRVEGVKGVSTSKSFKIK